MKYFSKRNNFFFPKKSQKFSQVIWIHGLKQQLLEKLKDSWYLKKEIVCKLVKKTRNPLASFKLLIFASLLPHDICFLNDMYLW